VCNIEAVAAFDAAVAKGHNVAEIAAAAAAAAEDEDEVAKGLTDDWVRSKKSKLAASLQFIYVFLRT